MNQFLSDLAYGFRVLLKAPATTTAAILALALGIGVNISSFISVDSMVLHALPYPNLGRIVTLWETTARTADLRDPLAPANFNDWKEQAKSFDAVATYRHWTVGITAEGNAERVDAARVSPSFFNVLGTQPILGRTFANDETASHVIVVSEAFWHKQLASSRNAIGQKIELAGEAYTVVGVMPDRFNFPFGNQVWAPLNLAVAESGNRSDRNLMVVARLKPNASFAQAQSETRSIGSRLAALYPMTNEQRELTLVSLRDMGNLETNHFTATLLGAAAFVLLLACANVANLQLARANARKREIAVRSVLGASARQIAMQLTAESILLSLAGGLLGLLLASWNLDFTKASIPPIAARYVPGILTMHISGTVLTFSLVVSLLTGILCSLPSILQLLRGSLRSNLNEHLKEGARAIAGSMRNRLRSALIVGEIVLAIVQLVGAGLMVKAFRHMLDQDLGYNPKNLLTMTIALPATRYRTPLEKISFYNRLLDELETLPNSNGAGIAASVGAPTFLAIEGRPNAQPSEIMPDIQAVSPGYWHSMAISMLAGRAFGPEDKSDSTPVAIVSRSVARHYWPNRDALGQRIRLDGPESQWLKVVGVCGDINDWFRGDATPIIYRPYTQTVPANARLTVRSPDNPIQAAQPVRSAIRAIDSAEPVYEVRTMEDELADESAGVRLAARTMSIYAVIALLLASTGIYAVISYFVTQRTHDIGIRMALGAARTDVFRLTMWQTVRLVMAGLALGIPAAYALTKLMSSVLFNTVALDPLAFAGFPVLLTAAALLASFLPARRATRIDPMAALRNE